MGAVVEARTPSIANICKAFAGRRDSLSSKIVLGLVQGRSAQQIHLGGLCPVSQVYRVAERFVEEGLLAVGDRSEDNGQAKVTEEYEWWLLIAVAKSPRDFGYRRPTWTQELLSLVLKKEAGIKVSCTTICRLLKRNKVRLGRPKPVVGCPWKKALPPIAIPKD